ncbi:hypothetical protein B0H10DRAFT_1993565 [Mycena sp. CBHHK59/15]|nr:hypothetical protein B0H10DRAFT_1993565 [Mycena sp. CBHHK59/15]
MPPPWTSRARRRRLRATRAARRRRPRRRRSSASSAARGSASPHASPRLHPRTRPCPTSRAPRLSASPTGLSPVSAASSDTSFDRPLPRTPLPCDVLDDGAEDWVARAREPPLHPYPSLAALLSPPPPPASTYTPASKALPTIPTEADVPADAEEDDEWADVVLDDDEVPLSPLVASSPTSDEEEAKSDEQREWEALQAHPLSPSTPSPPSSPSSPSPPSPALARNRIDDTYTPRFPPTYPTYTGWHPRPAASPALYRYNAALLSAREAEERETEMRSAELEGEWAAELAEAQAQKEQEEQEKQEVTGQHRELKSKWSSSTLSSVASAHARSPQASAKGFGFRRLLSSPNNAKSTSTKSRPPSARPMGAVTPRRFAPPVKKTKKRLTAADVVVVGRPPATPSLLASASASLFSPPALASPSPSSSHSHSSSTSSSPGFPYAQQLAPTHGPGDGQHNERAQRSSSRSGSDGGAAPRAGRVGGV